MGSIIDFIASVNKISLVAFVGVLGFLVYEINLLRKEQLKKTKPTIPQFNTSTVVDKTMLQKQAAAVAPPVQKSVVKKTSASPLLIAILVLMIIAFLGISGYILFVNKTKAPEAVQTPSVLIQEVSSPGLKVYDTSWNEIREADAPRALKPGTLVYVGILTIENADIDRARIKVNQKDWGVQDITMQFNKAKNVYYKEYTVATGESSLKIDAQLHSSVDGWLGD